MPDTWRSAIRELLDAHEGRGLVHYVDLAAALGERWPYRFGAGARRSTPQASVWRELHSDERFEAAGGGLFRYLPWGPTRDDTVELSRDGGASLRRASGALRASRLEPRGPALASLFDDPSRRDAEIALRVAALDEARARLTSADPLDERGLIDLLRTLNRSGVGQGGRVGHSRYAPALVGGAAAALVARAPSLVRWVRALRDAPPEGVATTLDRLWAEHEQPVGGRLFASLVLHALDPERYVPYTPRGAEALAVAGFGDGGYEASGPTYLRYCEAAREYLRSTSTNVHLLDAALARELTRRPPRAPTDDTDPAFVPSAFLLLRDGARGAAWASRVRRDVRAPLEQLARAVAARVVEPLLNAPETLGPWAVETDLARVMARPGRRHEARDPYVTATFAPRKSGLRRAGIRLFLLLHPGGLDVGLALDPTAKVALERLSGALSTEGPRLLAHLVRSSFWARATLRPRRSPVAGSGGQKVTSLEDLARFGADDSSAVLAIGFSRDEAGRRDITAWVNEAARSLAPLFVIAASDAPSELLDALGVVRAPDEAAGGLASNDPPTLGYARAALHRDTGLPLAWLDAITRAACVGPDRDELGQVVLYGPPGTGKTFVAERVARHLVDGDRSRVELVQFHPSFSYEHFVEGYRPELGADGSAMVFRRVDGVLLDLIGRVARTGRRHVLLIDEINRGDLPQVFGELLYLLSRRRDPAPVRLARSGRSLTLPRELSIIGTMNTADRSIAHVDFALRRRFRFFELTPDRELLTERLAADGVDPDFAGLIGDLLVEVNRRLDDERGGGPRVGHAYFFGVRSRGDLRDVWEREIFPLVEDFLDHEPDRLVPYRWPAIERALEALASSRASGETERES